MMDNYELQPTEENLLRTLEENTIDRNQDILYFYDILKAQTTASAIAVDGRWGSGKTFFIKQTQLLINALNSSSNMAAEVKEKITLSIGVSQDKDEEAENNSIAVYYDAWENDNDIDPVLSIFYEIAKQCSIDFSLKKKFDFKLLTSIFEAITGRNLNGVIDALKSNNPVTEFKTRKEIEKELEGFFGKILPERGNRLIIFVDELDRCSPKFAISLLERIKHYIQDERITFVFSVNLEQLQHTVQHYYGNNFDACRYLDRFFNLRVTLPEVDMDKIYSQIGLDSSLWADIFSRQIIKMFNFGLREIAKFYAQVKAAIYAPTHNRNKYNFTFSDGAGREFVLTAIVPLLIGLKIADTSLYNDFIYGKNVEPLKGLFEVERSNAILKRFLSEKESFEMVEGKSLVTRDEIIERLYNAIFVEQYSGRKCETILGECEFSRETKEIALRAASMMNSCYRTLN